MFHRRPCFFCLWQGKHLSTASDMQSATLSGCPIVTDSLVKRYFSMPLFLFCFAICISPIVNVFGLCPAYWPVPLLSVQSYLRYSIKYRSRLKIIDILRGIYFVKK